MANLEANFPGVLPQLAPTKPVRKPGSGFRRWPPTPYRVWGDRGLANNDVLNPSNQTQCSQEFVDGLFYEFKQVENAVILYPASFNVPGHESEPDKTLEPLAADAFDNLNKINAERKRLIAHPELFGNELKRSEFVERFRKAGKRFRDLLDGYRDAESIKAWFELSTDLAEFEKAEKGKPAAGTPPWATWLQVRRLKPEGLPAAIKDFLAAHPEMILVGSQIVPHMGILIAERWRMQVENVIVALAQNDPAMADRFPKPQKMLIKNKIDPDGTTAVLTFTMPQPKAAQYGQVFAFGPQENIANLARILAMYSKDVTRLGFPQAVFMGRFLSREEAKKHPHLQPLL